MVTCEEKASKLLKALPNKIELPDRGEEAQKNPIYRFLKRESNMAKKILKVVRTDLNNTIEMCRGNFKPTNEIRDVAKNLKNDTIPKAWRMWVTELNVTQWVMDLNKRIQQLVHLMKAKDFKKSNLWIGGLFYPEAFLTATRQYVAQCIKVPLDELVLNVTFRLLTLYRLNCLETLVA